jgi:hypothetical protein
LIKFDKSKNLIMKKLTGIIGAGGLAVAFVDALFFSHAEQFSDLSAIGKIGCIILIAVLTAWIMEAVIGLWLKQPFVTLGLGVLLGLANKTHPLFAIVGVLIASIGLIIWQVEKHASTFEEGNVINHWIEQGKRIFVTLVIVSVIHIFNFHFYPVLFLSLFNMFICGGVFMILLNIRRDKSVAYLSLTGGILDVLYIKVFGKQFAGLFYLLSILIGGALSAVAYWMYV